MGTFDSLYASLDANAKKRGSEFENICWWFLQNDPTYAARLKRVWLWRQWPGRWRDSEAGVDLVAEDTAGKLWAIQAKAYGEDKQIPKREMDKWLAESSRAEFSYRLLITTSAAGLHHMAANTVAAQEKPVLVLDRQILRSSPVDWPATFEDLRPSPSDMDAGEPRLPENMDACFPLTVTEDFVDALRVRDQGDPLFEQWFALLERHVAEFGDARVPADYNVDNQNVGRWVIEQRQRFAKGKLSRERAERLRQLPGWTFSCYETAWFDNFHRLTHHVAKHGDARVPVGFEVNGINLGAWVVNQRSRHAAGKLAPHRVRLLGALPGWSWDPFLDTWGEGIRHLQRCGGELGGASVRLDYRCRDGFALGRWVDRARAAAAAGRLTPEQVAQWAAAAVHLGRTRAGQRHRAALTSN
jgi:hypothetical protein